MSLPFSLWYWFHNWLMNNNWMNNINDWNLLGTHAHNFFSLLIIIIGSLLRLSPFWLLWNNCINFSKWSFFRNNCLNILPRDLLDNLRNDFLECNFGFLHKNSIWSSYFCSSFFCDSLLNDTSSEISWNLLFICLNNLLILISNNSYFSCFITNFRNSLLTNSLHYNSCWNNILGLWNFSFNRLHNILQMSVFLNNCSIDTLSDYNFFNNLFFFFNLFSYFNNFSTNNFNLWWFSFVWNSNDDSFLFWLAWLMNNNCCLNFILWSLSNSRNNLWFLFNSFVLNNLFG